MIKFTKTKEVKTPNRAHPTDAGIDFFIPDDAPEKDLAIYPGEKVVIDSGIKLIIPKGYAGIFKNKSSIGAKGLLLGPCVVDSSYRGEIKILLWNVSSDVLHLNRGQKITQMLIQEVGNDHMSQITEEAFNQDTTKRGDGGFGSTGEK